ncbi:MAG: alpha-hydroxy acid oxidase [Acidimicrobiales bacterium]|jgi:4-hydroxymandelate oxidase
MRDLIAKWESEARARLAPEAYEYIARGAGEEISLVEAWSAWRDWRLLPRVLRDVSSPDTRCEVLGAVLPSPIMVAPTAYHVLADPEGEVASASGTREAGALYVMTTRATRLLEEVAAVAGDPWWFQVYMLRDRGLTVALVERAVAAGAAALILTGDTPIVGPKPRAAGPVPLTAEQYRVNFELQLGAASSAEVDAAMTQDPSITEDAIAWLADLSGLPVLVKGVLRGDDARRFLDVGAAGIVVSNHGGRELDGAIATAHALPRVVAAVDGRAPVLVDGGLRDGRSILKAICLGASGVMVGRPVVWALAAGGSRAVTELFEGLQLELAEAMMLAGATTMSECDRSLVEWRWGSTERGEPA